MQPDYTPEVSAAHSEIRRAIALLEGAGLEQVGQAQDAIAAAAAIAQRVPDFGGLMEDSGVGRDLRCLNALVQNALYFYRGWLRVASLAPAAYTATGGAPQPAAVASVCLEG